MMDLREIHQMTLAGPPGRECWQAYYTPTDGPTRAFCFPAGALETKVAEYDLDPEDVDGVLDVLFHEIHVPDPMLQPIESTPKKYRTTAPKNLPWKTEGAIVPMDLFTAPTIALAREAHLARIAEVKKTLLYKPKAPQGLVRSAHPFDEIRRSPRITQEGVERHRQSIETIRAGLRGDPLPKAPRVIPEEGLARRAVAMGRDEANPEVPIAPGWATLRLSQE